jgi:hypothetical protein
MWALQKSVQCNVSIKIIDNNRIDIVDTTGLLTSLFANEVTQAELAPAAPTTVSFSDSEALAIYLDANFFVG